ncbi:unnamed protein product [Acanthoscelides obtectus]|uniref:Uncharacterized protein n=1 Tax=Acanthoscelides obtectus TaxID=200917 RepID=A0A9P0Q3H6_ACAOB|nr:unnamed protein product [Acanthoscelides obtectus]CAK1677275.1 hypothetical protein AOBTE_LOCUS31221 [Acanthoscelides obtectus]
MSRKSELSAEEVQAINSPVRRSSRLSQTKDVAGPEKAPAASVKTRRSSASEQEPVQTKPIRGRRVSQDAVESKIPSKTTRRRTSVSSETVNEKPQESKPETKKPTRRNSLSDNTEIKVTPRLTRRRSASVDDGVVNENAPVTRSRRQSLEPLDVDVEAKRVTRSRRSSVETPEEAEIVRTPVKSTATKGKRRASVALDPIEEQTESRKSASPSQDIKELSIIHETSPKEEANKSSTSSPEKIQTRSSKSPVVNDTEKRKTISPRKSTRRSSSKSPVVKEDGTGSPKTRRSLFVSLENGVHTKSEEQQDSEVEPQSKIPEPKEGPAEMYTSPSKRQKLEENEGKKDTVETVEKQNGEVVSTNHDIDKNIENEQKHQETVEESQVAGKTDTVENASNSQTENTKAKSAENHIGNSDVEEEKENVLAKSNQEVVPDKASVADKILKLKDESVEVPLQEVQVRHSRISLGGSQRVSNVFRPKDVDFSFAEPMEVDELSMLNNTKRTNMDVSRVRDSCVDVDESVDDSFKLTLNETVDDSIANDESVLAGSKTNSPKIRLSEEQRKLLSETDKNSSEDVGECHKTCESDDYEFEVPSDDETESNKVNDENAIHQEKTDDKQKSEDSKVDDVEVGNKENSKTDALVDQSQTKIDVDHSVREVDEHDAGVLKKDKEDEIDYEQPTVVIEGLCDEVQSQDSELDQTVKVSREELNDDINVKKVEVMEADDAEVDEKRTVLDMPQGKTDENDEVMNDDSSEEAKVNNAPEKKTDTSLTLGKDTVEDVKSKSPTSAGHDEIAEVPAGIDAKEALNVSVKSTQGSPVTAVKRKSLTISPKTDTSLTLGKDTVEDVKSKSPTSAGHDEIAEVPAGIDAKEALSVSVKSTQGSPVAAVKRKSRTISPKTDTSLTLGKDTVEDVKSKSPTSAGHDEIAEVPAGIDAKEALNVSVKSTQGSPVTAVKRKSRSISPKIADENSTSVNLGETLDISGRSAEEAPATVAERMSEIKSSNAVDGEDSKNLTVSKRKSDINSPQIADGKVSANIDVPEASNISGMSAKESPVIVAEKRSEIISPKIADSENANVDESEPSPVKSKLETDLPEIDNSPTATKLSTSDSEAIEIDDNSTTEAGSTPDQHKSKQTRKLLKTVDRNSTRWVNQDDPVTVVDKSESSPTISSKINKYIDSKIADILLSNSSTKDDSISEEPSESMNESVFESGETDSDATKRKKNPNKSTKRDTEDDHGNEDESCGEEESDEENDYIDSMAEEGEEDTPSEDSNAIIDEGESVGSTDSEKDGTDEYDSNDSFICDDDEEEKLLPGHEFDLEIDCSTRKKRKSRIINVDNEDTDVIIMSEKGKSVKPRKASSQETSNESSSSESKSDTEDAIVPQDKSAEKAEPATQAKSETPFRRSSITILENVNVKDIKDPGMSERIHSLMESFTTNLKEGDISMNLSLEYINDGISESKLKKRKSESSEEGESDTKKAKVELDEGNVVAVSSKKSKKKKHKTSVTDDLKTKTFSLMSQLITDVKNRPKRLVKPSTTMESSWTVENAKAKPSVSMITKKDIEEFKAKKAHPKDLRQKLLYDSGRVKRVDAKTLLKRLDGR